MNSITHLQVIAGMEVCGQYEVKHVLSRTEAADFLLSFGKNSTQKDVYVLPKYVTGLDRIEAFLSKMPGVSVVPRYTLDLETNELAVDKYVILVVKEVVQGHLERQFIAQHGAMLSHFLHGDFKMTGAYVKALRDEMKEEDLAFGLNLDYGIKIHQDYRFAFDQLVSTASLPVDVKNNELVKRIDFAKLEIKNEQDKFVAKKKTEKVTAAKNLVKEIKRYSSVLDDKAEFKTYDQIVNGLLEWGVSEEAIELIEDRVAFESVNILDILDGRVEIGLSDLDLRYIASFRSANHIANKIIRPKRDGFLIRTFALDKIQIENGLLVMPLDYTRRFGEGAGLSVRMENVLLAETSSAEKKEYVETYIKNGEEKKSHRVLRNAEHIYYGDMVFSTDPDMNEMTLFEADEELYGEYQFVQDAVMNHGFYVRDEHGSVERDGVRYSLIKVLMQSPSQERQVKATAYNTDQMDLFSILSSIGHDPISYAKKKGDKYVLDIVKMLKRPGLSGSNTIASRTIDIGNEIVELSHGEYLITGGKHVMKVAADRFAWVKSGKFKAVAIGEDQSFKGLRTVDAKDFAQLMTVGDGLVLCDESIYKALVAEFGYDTDAWQIRLTPFTKGLMVFVPGLKQMEASNGADIVAFESAVKGNYKNLFAMNPTFKPQLRIAIFNKQMHMSKKYTRYTYQFSHISSLTADDHWEFALPRLQELIHTIQDITTLRHYMGIDKLDDLDLSVDEGEYLSQKTLTSRFAEYLHIAPELAYDVQMQQWGLNMIKDKVKEFTMGAIPAEGHYRYMVQDPYALLSAIWHPDLKGEGKGGFLVSPECGLQAGEAFVANRQGKAHTGKVVAKRNPAIAKGEGQVLQCVRHHSYEAGMKFGAFKNLLIQSVHDFTTFAMGGASL